MGDLIRDTFIHVPPDRDIIPLKDIPKDMKEKKIDRKKIKAARKVARKNRQNK